MSRDERFSAREKKTHKMPRDGLVERNETTGEESRISQRGQDFKLRERLDHGDIRDRPPASERGGHSQRRPHAPPSQDLRQESTDSRSDAPASVITEEHHTSEPSEPPSTGGFIPVLRESAGRGDSQGCRQHQHGSQYQRQFQVDAQNRIDTPLPDTDISQPQEQLPAPPAGRVSDDLLTDAGHSQAADILPDIPRAGERPGRLRFDSSAPTAPTDGKPDQRGTKYAQKFSGEKLAGDVSGTDRQNIASSGVPSEGSPNTKHGKPSRLQFSTDETSPKDSPAKPNRKLEKSRLRAERSAEKLGEARKKLPTRRKPRLEKAFDAEKGKVKRKLHFEKEVKSQQEHLKGALPLRPVKAGSNAAIGYAHKKLYQVEQENVGVEAAHKGELMAEGFARHAYRQALHDNPQLRSNMLSRFVQKQKIKRQYAKATREAKRGAGAVKKAGETTAKLTQAVAGFIRRHPVGVSITLLILMMVFLIMTMFGSCSNMAVGILSSMAAGSYVAEDQDIDNAELAYTEWESDLQMEIRSTEVSHPGFDEYRYNVDDISHDPYELLAFLTAKYQDFTFAGVQAELRAIFAEQYTLSFDEEVEIRYRTETHTDTWTDEEGNTHTDTYEVEVPYEWHILNVSLTARSFSEIISSRLNSDEREHFGVLMST